MLADELDIIGYEVVLEPDDDALGGFKFTVQVPSDVVGTAYSVTVPPEYLASLPDDTPLKVEVGAIERRVDMMMLESFGNTTFTEEDGFCNTEEGECPEEGGMLAAVALAPSVGSVGSGGAGAISWLLMLAIGSALGLLGWMRRRKTA